MRVAVVAAALLALASEASAEEDRRWSAEARSGWAVLGPGERPTGGLTLGAAARYSSRVGESWGWHAGASMDAVGVGDSWHWLGIVGGPDAGVWARLDPVRVELTLELPYGQLPVCNDWGLCLRYWGIYPGANVRAAWQPSDAAVLGAELGGLYVDTLGWTGVGWTARAVGSWAF